MIKYIFCFLHLLHISLASNTIRIGGVFATLNGNKPSVPSIHRKTAFLLAIEDIEKEYQTYHLDIQIAISSIKSDFLNALDSARIIMSSFQNKGLHGCICAAIT